MLKAFQIRPTVDLDSPLRSAILERDQWVAFSGVLSKVATTMSSTWSVLMVAGRPGRGSSLRPSKRCSTNRERHFVTVGAEHPTKVATSLLAIPSAQAKTIRERSASACEDLRLRVHRESWSRSSSVRISSALGRPVRAMHQF